MNKTLIMHFRLAPSTSNPKKRILGKTSHNVDPHLGITVYGMFMVDHIKWGASLCLEKETHRTFSKSEGIKHARNVAQVEFFETKNFAYDEAKLFANKIANRVWMYHAIKEAMVSLFLDEGIWK